MCSINNNGQSSKPVVTGNIFVTMQILSTIRFVVVGLLLLAGAATAASAAGDVSVKAELSRPEVAVGEMAELQIKVTGAENANVPREISVEGLQIRLTGQSTQVQMVNFKISSSVVYSYIVMPLRTGKFIIPSIPVRSDAGMLQTAPLSLSVVDSSGTTTTGASLPLSQPGMPGFSTRVTRQVQPRVAMDKLAFGEIHCPKKTLYLGEVVPVEISYFFDARYQVQIMGKVDFGSEGILVDRFPEPKQTREDRDGVTYNVITFRTLLSAVKPGTIEVAPAKMESQIEMPGELPPGFDDPVFQQLLGGRNPMVQPRKLSVATAPLHLEILPLPKEGRPDSFAGAVGQFDIDASVANPKPAPGDPVVLTVKIGGKGNFNAMGAPMLTGTEGWRTYPPTDKFESSDQLSFTGVKTFNFTLIAQQPMKSSPGSEFSYFDPVLANYVTLTTKPLALIAAPAPAAQPTAPTSQATPQTNSSTTPPVHLKSGETEQLSSMTLHSWKSPIHRSEFLIASLAMGMASLALAGILHLQNCQARSGSATMRRRRLAEILTSLKSESLDAGSSYDLALEYLSLLAEGDTEPIIIELSARRDLLKYGVGGSVALSREERAKLLETLHKLSATKA